MLGIGLAGAGRSEGIEGRGEGGGGVGGRGGGGGGKEYIGGGVEKSNRGGVTVGFTGGLGGVDATLDVWELELVLVFTPVCDFATRLTVFDRIWKCSNRNFWLSMALDILIY